MKNVLWRFDRGWLEGRLRVLIDVLVPFIFLSLSPSSRYFISAVTCLSLSFFYSWHLIEPKLLFVSKCLTISTSSLWPYPVQRVFFSKEIRTVQQEGGSSIFVELAGRKMKMFSAISFVFFTYLYIYQYSF